MAANNVNKADEGDFTLVESPLAFPGVTLG